MDNNVLDLLEKKLLPKVEAKRALKATFEALAALHDQNIVHTGAWRSYCEAAETDRFVDVKPDNILVKNSTCGAEYKLSDLGDSASTDVLSNDGGHLIGAEIFCAPEVPLGVPWTTKADVWAAGATVSELQTALIIYSL